MQAAAAAALTQLRGAGCACSGEQRKCAAAQRRLGAAQAANRQPVASQALTADVLTQQRHSKAACYAGDAQQQQQVRDAGAHERA